MTNPNPSPATRFPHNKPGGGKKPGGYLTPKLKKWLKWKIFPMKNPDTGEMEDMEGTDAVVAALIKKAIKGDVKAIELILDRIDGKAVQKTEFEMKVTKMATVLVGDQPLQLGIGGKDGTDADAGDTSDAGEIAPDPDGA